MLYADDDTLHEPIREYALGADADLRAIRWLPRPIDVLAFSPFRGLRHERFMGAEALDRMGRLGRDTEGAASYRRFVGLWEEAGRSYRAWSAKHGGGSRSSRSMPGWRGQR